MPPLSNIVPMVDIDFTHPAQSNVNGTSWSNPGDVDLAAYYPSIPPLYFAATAGCTNMRVCIDNGLVLESESLSTKEHVETFAVALELPAGAHDKQIYVVVEFDVAEVLLSNEPFLGAVVAVANEFKMKTGKIGYDDKLSATTCQMLHNAGPPKNTAFRMNAPQSTGGQKFQYTPFDFFRPVFQRPIPPTTDQVAFANHSTRPLVLEHTINASSTPGGKAPIEVNLSQNDNAALKHFVLPGGGSNTFVSNIFKNSLSSLGFAGVALSITRPQGLDDNAPTNPGPARVRIKRLAIAYS
jgi:hypothetical protein